MSLTERTPLWEPDEEEKLGPTLLTDVLALATILLILGVAALIGLTVRRHFRHPPVRGREAPQTAAQQREPSECNREPPNVAENLASGATTLIDSISERG